MLEERIDDLLNVPGIGKRKLLDIKTSFEEHKASRDVVLFLQGYGISTLFAVKIYKAYETDAIAIASKNPYQLAKDIYGISFSSADKIALDMGFERDGGLRIKDGIKHVLAASRKESHCYLTKDQIIENTTKLLQINEPEKIQLHLDTLLQRYMIKTRSLFDSDGNALIAYYSESINYDEHYVATRVKQFISSAVEFEVDRGTKWVKKYCQKHGIALSSEQQASVFGILGKSFSILTVGPGCGKATTLKVLVNPLQAMDKWVVFAAPQGRAAWRMSEVIGTDAETIHPQVDLKREKKIP